MINTIGLYSFAKDENLKYIEFADATTVIEKGAFNGCSSLVLSDLNKVNWIGGVAFVNLFTHNPKVVIAKDGGELTFANPNCFAQNAIRAFELGSAKSPLTNLSVFNGVIFSGVGDYPTYPETITVYIDSSKLNESTVEAMI
jgi:hypothetical protein